MSGTMCLTATYTEARNEVVRPIQVHPAFYVGMESKTKKETEMKILLLVMLALPAFAQADDNPLLSEGIWTLAFTVAGAAASVAWPLIRAELLKRLDWKYRVAMDGIAMGVAYAWRAGGKEMKAAARAEGRKLTDTEAQSLNDVALSAARDYALENGVTHPVLESKELAEPLIDNAVEERKKPVRMRHGHKAVAT